MLIIKILIFKFLALAFISCNNVSADDYVFEGQKSMRRQNVEEAIEYFDKAIKKRPKHVRAHLERGKAHFNLGNYDRALEDFNKTIDLSPDKADAYYSRGRVYQFLDNMSAACVDWRKAAEYDFPYIDEHLKMCRGY